jgi:predicted ATPase
MSDFIERFTAKNYGCLKDVTVALTPLHALIGPNDSGKSTLLHGMRTVVQLVADRFEIDKKGKWKPFDPFLVAQTDGAVSHIAIGCRVAGASYFIRRDDDTLVETIEDDGSAPHNYLRSLDDTRQWGPATSALPVSQLRAARLVRFDPDALRAPSGLIPETSPVNFLDDRGLGLAGVYFAIKNRDDGTFARIIADVRNHFPTIKSVRVKAVTSSEVVLEADLASGAKVEARRMSEGLLYYLAFAALQHLDPVSLLLVEEPENGLHPARIVEVMRILREISRTTQVLLATHSPLVINEMQPEEVSVVTRKPDEGKRVTPMKKTANFEKRSSVYALGELWLSFADGVEEAPLIEGRKAS